jgi:hypothetical protein
LPKLFIAQAIIDTLIIVVKQCFLNQSQGYWLLSYVFDSTFSLCTMIKANVCRIQALNQPFIWGDFDSELQEFKLRMMGQVFNTLKPCLAFYESYIIAKAHSMFVIMLDPCFKNMKVIRDFVGNSLTFQIVAKYDVKIVYPLLVQAYLHLNPMKARWW